MNENKERMKKYRTVKKWKGSLASNAKSGSLSTMYWSSALGMMYDYVTFVESGPVGETDPDKLLDNAVANPDATQKLLMDWFNWLQGEPVESYTPRKKAISQSSARSKLGTLRGFYTHNGVAFVKWRMPQRKVSAIEQVDASNGVFKYDRETDTLYVDHEKLQKFASELNERDCVILECLISTSQDPTDLFSLTIGWLKSQEGELNLFWMGERNKTQERFKTFFSEEATASVREYVMRHRQDAGDDEPIFVKHRDYDYEYNGGTIEVAGPMNAGTLNSNFRSAAERLGHTKSGKQNPFRPKRFRHLFRTAAATAKLDEGIAQCFMGHSSSISATYLSKDPSWLLGQYMRMQDYVTIFPSPSEREDVKKLKQSLEAARLERDELREKLKEQTEKTTITEEDAQAEIGIQMSEDNSGLGGGVSFKPWDELSDEEKFKYRKDALMRKMLGE